MPRLSCGRNVQLRCSGSEEDHRTHRRKNSGNMTRAFREKENGRHDCGQAKVATHFTVCVGVWVQGESYGGAQLPGLTGGQLLSHGQDPQTMGKASLALCTTSPSQRRREGHGGGGGGGEKHGATLTLPVTRAVVPVHGDRRLMLRPSGVFV